MSIGAANWSELVDAVFPVGSAAATARTGYAINFAIATPFTVVRAGLVGKLWACIL